MSTVAGAILEIVQIKNGVKTENALLKRTMYIAMMRIRMQKRLVVKNQTIRIYIVCQKIRRDFTS